MVWTLAPCLEQFRDEVNAWRPDRDKRSDGAIGDADHAATASDHNPNAQGVVCAYDVDTDLDGTDDSNDPEMEALFQWLIARRHPCTAFFIFRRRIVRAYDKPGIPAWTIAPYTGADDHTSHLHLSVGQGPEGQRTRGTYNDTSSWLNGFEGDDVTDEQIKNAVRAVLDEGTATGELGWAATNKDLVATVQQLVNIGNGTAALLAHKGGAVDLSDADLKAVATAVNDELARRQAN